ncbi:hypothetical protein ES332_D04G025400v1 [Gossypium tomentosum]|uniref:Uncharacterized protein n=1 Tax=Gossypium tomentosum TaxID=34277 RepID=A0A5D2L8S8_GOSTO|nr:hypothetical protein ES332_D04G025400v1 [Gossypium tomentosum]
MGLLLLGCWAGRCWTVRSGPISGRVGLTRLLAFYFLFFFLSLFLLSFSSFFFSFFFFFLGPNRSPFAPSTTLLLLGGAVAGAPPLLFLSSFFSLLFSLFFLWVAVFLFTALLSSLCLLCWLIVL